MFRLKKLRAVTIGTIVALFVASVSMLWSFATANYLLAFLLLLVAAINAAALIYDLSVHVGTASSAQDR